MTELRPSRAGVRAAAAALAGLAGLPLTGAPEAGKAKMHLKRHAVDGAILRTGAANVTAGAFIETLDRSWQTGEPVRRPRLTRPTGRRRIGARPPLR